MRDHSMWDLDRKGEFLYWAGCNLTEVAREHGTPLYVVNPALIAKSYQDLCGAFESEGLRARVFFSYKTNPLPAMLKVLASLGCGAEIISGFEMWLAARYGIDGSAMIVNGSVKPRELLCRAVETRAALINVESPEELRVLGEVAEKAGRSANVGLRINPCVARRPWDFTLGTGSSRSHIGFRGREGAWGRALSILRDFPALKLRGLHFHVGSGIRSPRPYEAAIKFALGMWRNLLDHGFAPDVLDIGGGFGTATVKALSLLEAIKLFGWGRPVAAPSADCVTVVKDIARALAAALRDFAEKQRITAPAIYMEPGRSLVSSAQMLLLRVEAVRARPGRAPVAVCDAGALSLSPLLLTEFHAIQAANKAERGGLVRYDLAGNLPAPLDLVAIGRKLPALQNGDVLAVMDTGAYFTALGNNFGGPRPAVVTVADGAATLVRHRESFEEMISRDMR